jgi:hypothetical protein
MTRGQVGSFLLFFFLGQQKKKIKKKKKKKKKKRDMEECAPWPRFASGYRQVFLKS